MHPIGEMFIIFSSATISDHSALPTAPSGHLQSRNCDIRLRTRHGIQMPFWLWLHCDGWRAPCQHVEEVILRLPFISQHCTRVRQLGWGRHQWMWANSVQCNEENTPSEMVALENSKNLLFLGKKSMHLGSPTSKIHRLEGCGIVNMRSWRGPGIISRALLPAPWCPPLYVGEPPALGTVILPSVTSLWVAAGLLHKFFTGGEVLAAFGTFWTHPKRVCRDP